MIGRDGARSDGQRVKGVRSGAPFLFLGLAFFLTLLLQKSFVLQSDEGYTLNAAWQVWNGMRMYDDFRLFVAPGAAYAVRFVWAITGPSYLAARIMSLLFSFSSILAVYLTLIRRGVRGFGLAVAVVVWVIACAQYVLLNHNTFSSYAAAWMLLLMVRAHERDRPGGSAGTAGPQRLADHAFVGVASGFVVLFLQTKGFILLGAAAAFTLVAVGGRRGLRAAGALVGGAAVVVAPLLLVWKPSVLVREWFTVPITNDYLGHTGASRPLAVACVLIAAAMAVIAIRLRDRLVIAVAVFQAALVASMLHNTEAHHVAVNSFPLMVFVPFVLQRLSVRTAAGKPAAATAPSKPASPTAMMAIIVGMFALLMATPSGRPLWRQSTLYFDFIRRFPQNLFPQPRVAAAHAIYAGPFMPGLYFALGKKNPYFVSETIVCNDDCLRRLLAEIEAIKPEIAFLDYQLARHMRYDVNNRVDTYFRDRYVACPPSAYEGLLVRAIDSTWCP